MGSHRRRIALTLVIVLLMLAGPMPSQARGGLHFRWPTWDVDVDLSSPLRAVGSALAAVPGALAFGPRAAGALASGMGDWVGGLFSGDDAAAQTAPEPASPVEITSLRDRDAKHFRNPDGTNTGIFSRYLHYEAAPGQWEEVDLTLRPDGGDYVMDRHDIVVRVTDTGISATERKSGKGVFWPTPVSPTVQGRKISFQGPYGLTWSYYTTRTGLKLVATVPARVGARTYSFPYSRLGGAAAFRVGAAGELQSDAFSIPPAVAYGANGEWYLAGAWRIEGSRVSFVFDDSGLPAEAFPYELDPSTTFSVAASGDDGHTYKQGTTYPPTGATGVNTTHTSLLVSRKTFSGGYQVSNGLVRWDTSSLPDLATVGSATMRIFVDTVGDGDNRVFTAEWYSAWPIDEADYAETAVGGASPSAGWDIGAIVAGQDNNFSLINYDLNISRTGSTGLRLHISGAQPLAMNQVGSYTYDSATQPEPRLILTYTDPAPTILSAADAPDPVAPAGTITFSVKWKDPGDEVKAVICKTNSVSAGTCPGGAWAAGALSSTSPSSASYTPAAADAGARTYYAFACDKAGSCSDALPGGFTVNTPPAATGLAPASGTFSRETAPTLSGIYSDADANSGRLDFELYREADGVLVASGSGPTVSSGQASPWTVPAGTLADGVRYFWRARAYDGIEFSSWSSNVVYVPDTSAPTGALTAPANEATVSGTLTITASPADGANGSGVKQVDFYAVSLGKKTLIATDANGADGWSAPLDSRSLSEGRAILVAEYTDNAGNQSCCAPGAGVAVVVDNATPAPEPWAALAAADGVALADSDAQVVLGTRQLVVGAEDDSVPGRGFDAVFARGYNSASSSAGILGPGWRASLEAALVPSFDGSLTWVDGAGGERRFAPATSAGLDGAFFNTTDLSGTPALSRVDPAVDFNWGTASPGAGVNADGFSARWRGLVSVPAAGTWTFYATSDDGARVLLDGVYVINNWRNQTPTEASGTIALGAGLHELTVEYYDAGGDAVVSLSWAGPGVAKQVVPGANLFRVSGYTAPAGIYDALVRNADGSFTLTDKHGIARHYTAAGLRDTVTDRNGNTLRVAYDAQGRPQYVCVSAPSCDASAAKLTLAYDPSTGRLSSVSDPYPRDWSYAYDAQGRLASVTDALGNLTAYAYDASGRLSSVKDAELAEGRVAYDASGRVASVKDPRAVAEAGPATTFTYGAGSATVTSAEANARTPVGPATAYSLGSSGEMLSVTDPLGRTSRREWDGAFNATKDIDPLGKETFRAYDSKGNLLSETDPLGNRAEYTYWPDNSLKTLTGPRGTVTADPDDFTTRHDYDANGSLLSITDPLGKKTSFTYDAFGQRRSEVDPRGNEPGANPALYTTAFDYWADGTLKTVTDPGGNVTRYTYWPDGNPKKEEHLAPDGTLLPNTVDYTYDKLGNLKEEIDGAGGKTTYAYDKLGREIAVVNPEGYAPGNDPLNFTTKTEYSPDGLVKKLTDPLGNFTSYGYNWDGNQTLEIAPRVIRTESVYDLAGQLKQVKTAVGTPDEAITSYDYDAAGRLREVVDPKGTTTYEYDAAGQLAATLGPRLAPDGVTPLKTSNTHWPDGALKTVTEPAGNLAGASPGSYTTTHAYDAAGQLKSVTDAAGNLTSYDYDPAGNQTQVTDPTGAATTFSYDTLGREVERKVAGTLPRAASGSVDVLGTATSDTAVTTTRAGSIAAALSWGAMPTLATQTRTGSLAGGTSVTYDLPAQGENVLEASLAWEKGQTTQAGSFSGSLSGGQILTHAVSVTSTHTAITGSLDWSPFAKSYSFSGSVAALGSDTRTVPVEGPGQLAATLTWANSTSSTFTPQTHLKLELRNPAGTLVAQNPSGNQPASLTYTVPSSGPFGTYTLKVISADLAATYTLTGSSPVYANLDLELLNPANQVVASDTSLTARPASISYTPTAAGTYTFRAVSRGDPASYTLSTTYPILAYPGITLALLDPSGVQVSYVTGATSPIELYPPYVAAEPGGTYRVQVTNISSWATPSFSLALRSTSVTPTTHTGSFAGSGTASFNVISQGAGTLEADLDWQVGTTTWNSYFSGSLSSGLAQTHAVVVNALTGPVTGSLTWTRPSSSFSFGQWIPGQNWDPSVKTHSVTASAAGTISATLDWDNVAVNLDLVLYDPAGNMVAHSSLLDKPERVSYSVPISATGTYRFEVINQSVVGTNYTLTGTRPVYSDANLELLDPTNQVVASDYDPNASVASVSHTPLTTGTYTFRVIPQGEPAPSYSLSATNPVLAYADVVLKLYDPAGALKAQSVGRPGKVFVGDAAAGTYRAEVVNRSPNITVPAYTLVVRPPAAKYADLDLQLLDGGGTVLAQTSGAARPESLTYQNAPAGTYTLRVVARRYTANFTLDYTIPTLEVTSSAYDPAGRLETETGAAGLKRFVYDAADRLKQVQLPDGTLETLEYFADGALKKLTDPTGVQSFTYDPARQLKTATDQASVTTTYGYDAAGNETSVTRPGGFTAAYDPQDRLQTLTAAGTASFAYADKVYRTQVTHAAGDVDVREFSPDGLVTKVQLKPSATAAPTLELGYTYDAQGNLTQAKDEGAATTLASYTYDTLDRLKTEAILVSGQTRTLTYAYDAQGNRTSVVSPEGTTAFAYNPAGQILSRTEPSGAVATYLHDAAGNLATAVSASGTTTYAWTPESRLASLTKPDGSVVSFTYDAEGRRVTKASGGATTTYAYERGRLASETAGTATTSYTYDEAGAPLTITLPSGARYAYRYDRGGSAIQLTDASHQVAASYTYDAWGNVVEKTGSQALLDANPSTYRGQFGVRFDRETGLFLMGARYYDPALGRFISRDPIVAEPDESSYAYAGNNPVTRLDPTGLANIAGGANSWGCARRRSSEALAYLDGRVCPPDDFESRLPPRKRYTPSLVRTPAGWRMIKPKGKCSAGPIGNTGRSFNFTIPCKTHDYGYDLGRMRVLRDRLHVDLVFLHDMLAHCKTRSWDKRWNCRNWARTFYLGVRAVGHWAWNSRPGR